MAVDFEYERQAMQGEEMPKNLSIEDQMTFQALAYLYSRYRNGFIDKETGKLEKQKIKCAHNKAKRLAEFNKNIIHRCATLWINLESASNEYAKNRTIEAADKMYEIIYRVNLKG